MVSRSKEKSMLLKTQWEPPSADTVGGWKSGSVQTLGFECCKKLTEVGVEGAGEGSLQRVEGERKLTHACGLLARRREPPACPLS